LALTQVRSLEFTVQHYIPHKRPTVNPVTSVPARYRKGPGLGLGLGLGL